MTKISIGIPAYNEEKNIRWLLKSLLTQELGRFELAEIIVVSDASTDKTNAEVAFFNDRRIKLLVNERRQGVNASQNKIVKSASGDILIILNADVLPADRRFLQEIIKPFKKDQRVGLVGAQTIPTKSLTMIDAIISESHKFKNLLYQQLGEGDSIYLCHGRARAFSKQFYSQIHWPDDCPEDPYSYLFCLKRGFKFVYHPCAKVFFRSPSTLADHLRQSYRFNQGKRALEKYFPKPLLKKAYHISKKLLIASFAEFFLKHPFAISAYLAISAYTRLLRLNKVIDHSKWDVAPTTKIVEG